MVYNNREAISLSIIVMKGLCGLMRLRPIFLGILASFFFAITFVLNARMSLVGQSFLWSASLRYLFMIPFMLPVIFARKTLPKLLREIKLAPLSWILWSTIGFGLFYVPLCFSANYAPAWVIAAAWQFTIIAGSLLTPLFGSSSKMPIRGLLVSMVIFFGIVLVEASHGVQSSWHNVIVGGLAVAIAAFAYPLGNRKMIVLCEGRLSAIERVFGMTLVSLPLWIVLAIIGVFTVGLPPVSQVTQTAIVALSSGVIATVLFFAATDLTKGNTHDLAAVEATQSGEVVFTMLLSFLFVSPVKPPILALLGVTMIIVGMVVHSLGVVHSMDR